MKNITPLSIVLMFSALLISGSIFYYLVILLPEYKNRELDLQLLQLQTEIENKENLTTAIVSNLDDQMDKEEAISEQKARIRESCKKTGGITEDEFRQKALEEGFSASAIDRFLTKERNEQTERFEQCLKVGGYYDN